MTRQGSGLAIVSSILMDCIFELCQPLLTIMTKTVAIFGTTGAQGTPVVMEALAKSFTVRVVARKADISCGSHHRLVNGLARNDFALVVGRECIDESRPLAVFSHAFD